MCCVHIVEHWRSVCWSLLSLAFLRKCENIDICCSMLVNFIIMMTQLVATKAFSRHRVRNFLTLVLHSLFPFSRHEVCFRHESRLRIDTLIFFCFLRARLETSQLAEGALRVHRPPQGQVAVAHHVQRKVQRITWLYAADAQHRDLRLAWNQKRSSTSTMEPKKFRNFVLMACVSFSPLSLPAVTSETLGQHII